MESILILGASADQAFAFRTAKAMGLRVIAVDINPHSPCFAVADRYAVVSTRDVPAIKAFLDEDRRNGNRCAGVLVMGTDIPQIGAALAQYLGAPGISMASAVLATDKYKMKRRLSDFGVPVPWFSLVDSTQELRRIADERGFPLVLKPTDRSGARGVFLLTERSDLATLFEAAHKSSLAGHVMVEQYLPGRQISTESIIYDSTSFTPGFADRNYEMLEIYAPNIIENGGWVPSLVTAAERTAVNRLVERAALALGITEGVVKGDIVLTESGPALIEMAARLSGGDFCESLIPLGCGVNIVEAAINIAIGREPDLRKLQPTANRGVVNRYFFPRPGRLLRVEGVEQVCSLPWLKKLEFWYRPGDIVPPVASHADRFGVFVVDGESRAQADARAEDVYKTIKIITEPA